MRYAIVIEQAEGNYSAYVPDLPGCVSTGTTIEEIGRNIRLSEHLEDNPSLKGKLDQILVNAYRLAVIDAERETGLDGFPETCPYSIARILDAGFLPEREADG